MNWWGRLRRKDQLEEQLDKELHFHIEEHAAGLVAEGVEPGEARRQARIAVGGVEQVKEECRDERGTRWLEDFGQDLRYALRTIRQRPGFAAVVCLTLALGIGSTTLMFTVLNGVVFKPFPYRSPERLLSLQEKTAQATQFGDLWPFAYPNFVDVRRGARSIDVAAWRYTGGTISQPGDAEYVSSRQVSAELLSILEITPALGRTFRAEEDRKGAAAVVLVSDALWRRRFGARPDAIGATLIYNGEPYQVVGVLPAGFQLADDTDVELLTLMGQSPEPFLAVREAHRGIQVWARLKDGATADVARSELAAVGRRLAAEYPRSNEGRTFIADPLRPNTGTAGSTIWLLFGAVILVLLIGCVNIASLLVARASSRGREMAVRVALGAGRGRLIRQCLTESAVLGLMGGCLGLLLMFLTLGPFVSLWPGSLPRAQEVQADWRVFAFALVVSLMSGALFGAVPALRAPARELEKSLRAGSRALVGGSRRLQSVLVASELALAVVLLVSAGVLGSTFLRLSSLDPGVNIDNVLVTRLFLSPSVVTDAAKIRASWQDIVDRTRALPGVQSVAMIDTVPMRAGNNQLGYWANPAVPSRNELPLSLASSVTPDYLKVMGVALRAGRFFDETDRLTSQPVIVIDEVLARRAFGDAPAVGKLLWIPDMDKRPQQVIGVVAHVRHWGFVDDDRAQVRAQFYYSFAQVPDGLMRRWSEVMSIAVRTENSPLGIVEPLRRAIRTTARDQVLTEIRTMDQLAEATLARHRFLVVLFGAFAGIALLLACIGIYGVLAFLSRQRVPEFGVRMALGANARDILRLVLRQSVGMIAAGVVIGSLLAYGTEQLLERSVPGIQLGDPVPFLSMVAILIAAALAASVAPARKASRISPVTALRQE
jgi:predicted permease